MTSMSLEQSFILASATPFDCQWISFPLPPGDTAPWEGRSVYSEDFIESDGASGLEEEDDTEEANVAEEEYERDHNPQPDYPEHKGVGNREGGNDTEEVPE